MIGIDEAGRGALAGPVVAACVCLHQKINNINDSKKLSFKKRLEVFEAIKKQADFIGIGIVGPRIIDEGNILKATLNAMKLSHQGCPETDIPVIVDGNVLPDIDNAECVVKADAKFPAVMAASIVAKVYRDSIMIALANKYRSFNFDENMGYGTSLHLQSISDFKISDYHRTSFKPVAIKKLLSNE